MGEQVEVHGFETSGNVKVRIALGYEDIPHVFHVSDPVDREEVVRFSGRTRRR